MNSFEFNKIFAAILVAGITLMLGNFIAGKVNHPDHLEKDAVEIDGDFVAASSSVAEPVAEPILSLIATADLAKGEKLSKACAACHSFDVGGPNKVGPNLYNIVSSSMAGKSGFSYSKAIQEMNGVWGYDELNKFLWKPKKYMPGTKMNYAGLKKPQDRAAIISWLRTLSNSPAILPSAVQIEAEQPPPPVEVDAALSDGVSEAVDDVKSAVISH